MQLRGQRVLVVGLGASGRAAARLVASRGAVVTGVDLSDSIEPIDGVTLELGPHDRATFLAAQLIVVSPGVPSSQPDIVAAEQAGVPIVGELGLACALLSHLPMVGITGTNGKSTVTSFVGQILASCGLRAFVGGNLGNPLSNALLDGQNYELAVIEASSYQLERAGDFAPRIAVVLNLSPDHLARHGDMRGYAAAKARIFQQQTSSDVAMLPADDALLREASEGVGQGRRVWLGALPGVVRAGRQARVQLGDEVVEIDLSQVSVPGEHNLDNAAVAVAIALHMGAEVARVRGALAALNALEHRMEVVREHAGVQWINDSKATNLDAARVGVSGLDRPAVVLLGGRAKSRGFDSLIPHLERQRAVVTFGGSGDAIADELLEAGYSVIRTGTLSQAVELAATLAQSGDAVLLSPGGSSFDAFDNFEQRGRVFRTLVHEVTQ